MLFLDFYLRWFQHHEELGNHIYPWYVIVNHEALAAWWQWLWGNITISSGRLTPTGFKWLLHSDNLSTSSTIELFSISLQAKKIVGGLIPLDVGTSLKSQFQPSKHLICFATFQNRLRCLNSKPFNWTYHVVIKMCMSDVRNIHRRRSRFSTLSGVLRT